MNPHRTQWALNGPWRLKDEPDLDSPQVPYTEPGFDDSDWRSVAVFEDTGAALVASNGPAVKRFEELQPVAEPSATGPPTTPAMFSTWGRIWWAACG